MGIVTSRDSFVIDRDKGSLLNRIRLFKNNRYSDDELHTFFGISKKKGWSIRKAWDTFQSLSDSDLNKFIMPILYRPFDVQWVFYHDAVVERTRKEVLGHMIQGNLGLITCRQISSGEWQHALVTTYITDDSMVSNKTKERGYVFPLSLYLDTDKEDLFSQKKKTGEKQPNINPNLLESLFKIYSAQVGQTFLSDRTDGTDRTDKNVCPTGEGKVGQAFLPDKADQNDSGRTDKNVCSTGEEDTGVVIQRRKLPHWTLTGATYFVTFRTLRETCPSLSRKRLWSTLKVEMRISMNS